MPHSSVASTVNFTGLLVIPRITVSGPKPVMVGGVVSS